LIAVPLALAVFEMPAAAADPNVAMAPRDYDAPDPDRNTLSYLRALANVGLGNYVIFQIDWLRGVDWIFVTRNSISTNFSSGMQFDYDTLTENMLGHPLQGSLDFNAARSAGLSFWESTAYSFAGALEWDYLAERQVSYPGGWRSKPSTNDFLTTATSGIILGEALYRLSSTVLDDSSVGVERALREVSAGVIDPMRGFNRLYTGEAWRSGAPPKREHPLSLALDLGIDRVRMVDLDHPKGYAPTALLALEIQYGDLLPTKQDETLDPFEFYEGYVAMNLFEGQMSGAQVYGQALLYGWSADVTADEGSVRDNNVFGFAQSFDFQGANAIQFGTMGVGPADYVEWRYRSGRKLRLGMGFDWTYLAAIASPLANANKAYDFGMGAAAELDARLDLGAPGKFDLRSTHYVTSAMDGQGLHHVVGYGRLSYEIDLFSHVGIGVSPTLVYERSATASQNETETSLETQLYLRVHGG
jgi:hypothetical protein